MNTPSNFKTTKDFIVIYDGECPFCSRYVDFLNIQKTFGEVELIDARERKDIQALMKKIGIDLDEGMVVYYKEEWHHGAMAMRLLALANNNTSKLSRAHNQYFKSTRLAKLTYPILRFFRNLILRILSRKKINP